MPESVDFFTLDEKNEKVILSVDPEKYDEKELEEFTVKSPFKTIEIRVGKHIRLLGGEAKFMEKVQLGSPVLMVDAEKAEKCKHGECVHFYNECKLHPEPLVTTAASFCVNDDKRTEYYIATCYHERAKVDCDTQVAFISGYKKNRKNNVALLNRRTKGLGNFGTFRFEGKRVLLDLMLIPLNPEILRENYLFPKFNRKIEIFIGNFCELARKNQIVQMYGNQTKHSEGKIVEFSQQSYFRAGSARGTCFLIVQKEGGRERFAVNGDSGSIVFFINERNVAQALGTVTAEINGDSQWAFPTDQGAKHRNGVIVSVLKYAREYFIQGDGNNMLIKLL